MVSKTISLSYVKVKDIEVLIGDEEFRTGDIIEFCPLLRSKTTPYYMYTQIWRVKITGVQSLPPPYRGWIYTFNPLKFGPKLNKTELREK